MPIKKLEPEPAAHLSVSDVIEVWDLGQLAWLWAARPLGIDQTELDRYRSGCDKFGIDPSLLLYTVQRMMADQSVAEQSQPVEPSSVAQSNGQVD